MADRRDDRRHPRWCHGHLHRDDLGSRRDHPVHLRHHRDRSDDRRSRHRRLDDRRRLGPMAPDSGSRLDLPGGHLGRRGHWDADLDRRGRLGADLDRTVADLDPREHLVEPAASRASCRGWDEVRPGQRAHSEPDGPCQWNHRTGCCQAAAQLGGPCQWNHRRGCCQAADLPVAGHLASARARLPAPAPLQGLRLLRRPERLQQPVPRAWAQRLALRLALARPQAWQRASLRLALPGLPRPAWPP